MQRLRETTVILDRKLIAAMLTLFFLLVVSACSATETAPPTAAFINLSSSSAAELAAQSLLAEQGVRWVEREQLQRIVREQELNAAFASDTGQQRVRLGRLLKANILVVVRRHEKPSPHHEIIVCETDQGLRLFVASHPESADAEADTRLISTSIRAGLKKSHDEIVDICAVSPLVSDDLGYEHDHLRMALAKVIEGALAKRPGTLLVEFAEAQALSRELAIRDQSAEVRRWKPYYFLGRFRHSTEEDRSTIQIRLELKRGGKTLARREVTGEPEAAAELVRQMTLDLTENLHDAEFKLAGRVAESQLLNGRAKTFETLANWDEAVGLAEASLLLDADQMDLRRRTVKIFQRLSQRAHPYGNTTAEQIEAGLRSYVRGLEHLETFLRNVRDTAPYRRGGQGDFIGDFIRCSYSFRAPSASFSKAELELWKETESLRSTIRRKENEAALRILRMRAKAGYDDSDHYLTWVLRYVPEKRRNDMVVQLCLEQVEYPNAKRRALTYAKRGRVALLLDDEEGHDLLRRFDNAHPVLQAAATALRAEIDEGKRRAAMLQRQELVGSKPIPVDQPLQFTKLDLDVELLKPDAKQKLNLLGALEATNGLDVYWNRWSIFVMHQRGKLQEVWNSEDPNTFINFVSFDGKYIWATVIGYSRPRRPPQIVLIDPASHRSWTLTREDGLPIQPSDVESRSGHFQQLAVCGYSPGKACVAGWFGQSWVALVAYDPLEGKRPKVEVLLECNVIADRDREEFVHDPKLAFEPLYMESFRRTGEAAENTSPRLLIGRKCVLGNAKRHPLIVDPVRRTIEVLKARMPTSLGDITQAAVTDDAIYTIGMNPRDPDPSKPFRFTNLWLYRQRWPNFKPEPIVIDPPPGKVVLLDDELHLCGRAWWTFDLTDHSVRKIGDTPWYYIPGMVDPKRKHPRVRLTSETLRLVQVSQTSHYGLVAISHQQSTGCALFTLQFAGRATDRLKSP